MSDLAPNLDSLPGPELSDDQDRQARIADWLEEQRPDLAGMYRHARESLANPAKPGRERTRVSQICHSMRELMNRLPDALGIAGGTSHGSKAYVRKLAEVAPRFPNVDLLKDVENVPVPRELAAILDDLVKAAVAEDGRTAANAAALLTDDGNTKHQAVREWRDLINFFVRWAHLEAKQRDVQSIPSDDDLRNRIELAEALMDGMRAEFFDSLHAVEDLLAQANQLIEPGVNDGYATPTAEQVQAALRSLTSIHLRRAFYEGLRNPLWVKPLTDAGAFSTPPEPQVGSDGTVRETYWPEASYLDAMTEQVPIEVANVLVTFAGSNNSSVRRLVFSAGSRLPSDHAARLQPVINAWEDSGGYGWRTDPTDLVSFTVNLLEGGQTNFGVCLANKLFRPTGESGADGDPVTELKTHWYSSELPRVARALGENSLKSILPWLILHEEQEKSLGEGFDHSGFGRSSIAQRRNSYRDDEIQDALIDVVRDAAVEQLDRDPVGAWQLLNRNPIIIVRRISLYAVAEVIERQAADGAVSSDLISVARELLLDAKSRDRLAVPDFIRLLRSLGTASPAELDQLAGVLASGQLTASAEARITGNLREYGESEDEIQSQLARWDRDWRHRVMAGVGRDLLPAALRAELDSLDAEDGVVVDPMHPQFQFSSWSGPNSPISQEEMAALAPMELVAQLEGWHAAGDGWGPQPSHEGQARVLEAVVSGNPLALHGQQDLVRRLRPTYLRAVLSGWEGGLKTDLDLPWDQVLSLASDVLDHADESGFPVEGRRYDDDPDFTEAKRVAIRLLAHLASVEELPEEHLNRVANLLLTAASDTAAWSEYFATVGDEQAEWDPLMVSLNWRWPILLRGLVNLVGLGASRQWHVRTLETLREQLALEDPRGASNAVIGEGLGILFNHAHDWLVEHLPTYFGTRSAITRNQQISLTTAIAMHYYHPALYRLLSDPMIAALNNPERVAIGWHNDVSPQQRIGQWVINGIIRGHIGDEDPLRNEFYTQADPETRGDAIGHIAWSFLHAEVVDDAIRDRLADLWDERVAHVRANPEDKAELKAFYWFIRSEKFAAEWWLPRLVEALELDGDLKAMGMIGEHLAASAEDSPRVALDALTMLLPAPKDTSIRFGYNGLRTHALAPVIAAALRTTDTKLQSDAKKLMNQMGARGEIDLDKRVAAILAAPAGNDTRN